MPGPRALYVGERLSYITPDGIEYKLHAPNRGWVVTEDGFGMPPIEYITERGPFQHGESVKDFFLRPRVIQVLIRRNGCDRNDYYVMRNEILDILRPGRVGQSAAPGVIRKYLPNGQVREFDAYASQGPSFPSHDPDLWDEWSFSDTLRFTCYDPIARGAAQQSLIVASSGSGLSFPITFPITFGTLGGIGGSVINYAGTWISYPTLILTGPLAGPLVRNLTTNELIQFNTTIAAGRIVTINLQYGFKTVTLDDGTNYIGYISDDSDMDSFHLQPGANNMQIFASGTSGASNIVIRWFERYIGL